MFRHCRVAQLIFALDQLYNLLPVLIDDSEPPFHRGRRGAGPSRATASAVESAAPSSIVLSISSKSRTAV
jgi:hypothetical protein